MKDMDMLDIILALEGGELVIEDFEDWETVRGVAHGLANSQGFYSRLYRDMSSIDPEELEFPIYM